MQSILYNLRMGCLYLALIAGLASTLLFVDESLVRPIALLTLFVQICAWYHLGRLLRAVRQRADRESD